MIYFDNAATTKVSDEVIKEMIPFLCVEYGNPSSIYRLGRRAKKGIEDSRIKIAKFINAKPQEIFFTSGGSESDNLAIKGIAHALKNKGNHIITSKIEHHAIINSCKTLEREGFEVTYLNVDKNGRIYLEELEKSITDKTILISIMFANNEIGTIEPIKEIGEIARKHKIIFHTDSVQAIGNVKIDVEDLNIDVLSISGHKFHAPKGVGALYVKEGVKIEKLQDGGHQEKNIRAGTENVPGIVGMGKAIEVAYYNFDNKIKKMTELRNYCIRRIMAEFKNVKLNGEEVYRLPGNVNVSFNNITGEELLLKLDEKEIFVSSGSACNSGNDEPSHVLMAIGLTSNLANSTIRITLGEENTKEEIDYLIECLKEIKKLRA